MGYKDIEYIAQKDKDPHVRIAAIQQLDPEKSRFTLEYIASHDEDPKVREAALRQN